MLRLAALLLLSLAAGSFAASAQAPLQAQNRVKALPAASQTASGPTASLTASRTWENPPATTTSAPGSLLASRGAQVSQRLLNSANHVFGPKSLSKHKLEGVLQSFRGDKVKAFQAIEGAAQQLATQGKIGGVFETTVNVAGQAVRVRGAVVDDVVKVGTAFIP